MQHAIQNREGFASGANPAYWNRRMENGFDSRTAEERREGARLQEQYEQMYELIQGYVKKLANKLNEEAKNKCQMYT